MDLGDTLHLAAGLGALGMGVAVLVRGGRARARNRMFAWLCACLAVWNLAFLGRPYGDLWRPVYLAGSCASAPLGLHFALVLAATAPRRRRPLLVPAYLLAAVVWLSSWVFVPWVTPRWPAIAIVVLAAILVTALVVIARHAFSRPAGAERRALFYMLGAGSVAVFAGMTDFMARDLVFWTQLGPMALLFFLLVVCVTLVRFRFLDVDVALGRLVALIAGSAGVASLFYAVVRHAGDSFPVLFLTSALVLALAVPLGRRVMARSRYLATQSEPLTRALLDTSRKLPRAITAEEIWRIVDEGRRSLPGRVHVDVYMRRSHQDAFHLLFRSGETEASDRPLPRDGVLPRELEQRRLPLTRWQVEQERLETTGRENHRLDTLLHEMHRLDLGLVAPFFFRERMGGWFALGGDIASDRLTAALSSEFLAVTNQAAAALNRIEALETARRKQQLAAIGELAAGLAHEVRNPLTAIRGAAQAIGPSATERQQGEMLEVIQEETARLDRVVGDFLHYARPAIKRAEAVDLIALAERVVRAHELAGAKFEVEFHVRDPRSFAAGDPDQLYRAVENLVRNAWEATGDGGQLRIDAYNVKGRRVAIRIEDNGPGIPPEDVKQLFKPFYTAKEAGTGLGLAMVHRIVEAHRGEISVEGRPGIGAAFTVVLPAADPAKGD